MGSGRAAAARTRSARSTPRAKARGPSGCGRWTRTWPRRSTESITTHLLATLGSFPARDMIRDWLKAGVFETGKGFAPTEEGTPQGGVIQPLLLNVALHGLEEAAGVRYSTSGSGAGETKPGSPVADQVRRRSGRALPHPVSRPNRSRRGLPSGWRPGVWSSTRTRRRSSTSPRTGSTSWGSTSAATAPSC